MSIRQIVYFSFRAQNQDVYFAQYILDRVVLFGLDVYIQNQEL